MPGKKSDAKKARKSSSAAKDAVTSSPSGSGGIVPPPNPTATHLVASNPFDDPPPQMKMGPGCMMPGHFQGPSMVRLQSPNAPMGPGYQTWGPRGEMQMMRPGFNGGGPNGWNHPHPGGPMGPHGPQFHPGNVPPSGFGPSRYSNPAYRGSPRMPMGNIRQGMVPLGSPTQQDMMMNESQNMGPNHMVSSGNQGHMLQNTGQMKALTRPPGQMPSPVSTGRKGSTSSNKNSDSKSPKASDGMSAKARKKAEKKAQENKLKLENEKLANGNNISAPPPHSIPPGPNQVCKRCNGEISVTEDAIRCLASCNMWYHRTCIGMIECAYKLLKEEELALWVCDNCLQTKEIHSVRTKNQIAQQQLVAEA